MSNPLSPSLRAVQIRVSRALNRSGRGRDSLRLIGVTKKQGLEKILWATEENLWDFGENYVQEWALKAQQLQSDHRDLAEKIHWHFIGHLQSNKARDLVGRVEWIHGLDRLGLARRISDLAGGLGIRQKVLLQVNLGGESSKSGYGPEELLKNLPGLAELPHLDIRGLMALPPPVADPEESRPYFKQLKSLLDECNHSGVFKNPIKELSMGMSQDFEVAIEEGATMIRLGTVIFGPRL